MDKLQGEAPAAVGMAFQIVAAADGVGRRFSYVSPTCEALNGVSADHAMADASLLYDLILPEYRERMAAAEAAALEQMAPFSIEVPFRRKDGRLRWFRITSAPHRLPDGSTAWDGIQLDITDQRLAQRRLEMALETTGLGLWEYVIETGQLYWSRRTRELYGVGPDEPVDFEFYQSRVHAEDRGRSMDAYQAALQPDGGDFSFEHRIHLPDGQVRWVLAHGRVIAEDGEPKLVIGTSLDITERKAIEEARALLLGELNHRVKNDFQIVSGLLELQARRADDAAVREELEKTHRRVAGIARAHQNLYAEGPHEEVELEVYLGEICRDLAEGLFQDSHAALDWRIDAVRLPRERAIAIGLIVNELVTNAAKHAFSSGRRGKVEVVLEAAESAYRLTVADDGPGLPPTYGQSKGLGRNLIQAFARQAGGRLDRVEGPGARFVLTLPR